MITKIVPVKETTNKKLILFSSSPRRSEILKKAGFSFEVRKVDFTEDLPKLPAIQVPEYLAKIKMKQCPNPEEDELFMTADTMVLVDDEIIGKPRDHSGAFKMIESISGRTHVVVSGVCLASKEKTLSFSSTTKVQFDQISESEINDYIELYKPFDKAGAYGIQEGIGLTHVKGIIGCYFNVMGLPIRDLYVNLSQFSY